MAELRNWSDHEMEKTGRLTAPLHYDAHQDRYVEVIWDEDFAAIGKTLRRLPREQGGGGYGHMGKPSGGRCPRVIKLHIGLVCPGP